MGEGATPTWTTGCQVWSLTLVRGELTCRRDRKRRRSEGGSGEEDDAEGENPSALAHSDAPNP
jgi:hypothetical protein